MQTFLRPRAHRAVGRLPPASGAGRRLKIVLLRERAENRGRGHPRQPGHFADLRCGKLYNGNSMSRYYTGPVSDHFDGERFFDRQSSPPRSRRELQRWLLERHWRGTKAKWPAWAPSPYADRPPPRVEGAGCRLSYVGHASWLIQTGGLNI